MTPSQTINNTQCTFPLCQRKADREGLCFLHLKHFSGPKPVEKPKAISIKSVKRIVDDKLYKKLVKEQVLKDDRCKIKSPVCTGKMEGFHHKQKRSPKNLLEKNNLVPSCNACNNYIENNSDWAKNHGFFISKFAKEIV